MPENYILFAQPDFFPEPVQLGEGNCTHWVGEGFNKTLSVAPDGPL